MERKILRNIYILAGVFVLLLVGMILGWFFVAVRPQREKIATTQKQYDDRKIVADKLKGNLAEQKKAEDKRRYLEGQLAFFRGRYRHFTYPELGVAGNEDPKQKAQRIATWRLFVREYFSEYGEALKQELIDAADAADDPMDGRKFLLNTQVKVDAPPKAPEDLTIPAHGLLKPTSASNGGVLNVTVTGSFAEIKNFFVRINRSPILFVVGNIKLDGASPTITATFTLTPYLVATGPGVKLAAAAPAGGAGGGDPDAPGMPGLPGGAGGPPGPGGMARPGGAPAPAARPEN